MRNVFKLMACALVLAASTLLCDAQSAQAQERLTKVGALRCNLAPTVGFIIGSRQRMTCRFISDRGGRPETYSGRITRIGLDVGFTAGGVMSWVVLTRTAGIRRGALAGTFVGASGDIALGLGVGANALIGGSRRSTVLQPLSVSGQIGLNLALGVAGLHLRLVN